MFILQHTTINSTLSMLSLIKQLPKHLSLSLSHSLSLSLSMGAPHLPSSMSFDLKIIRARNIDEQKSSGYLFVRCYLSAGNNSRVKLESKEILPKSDLSWNESFSLQCLGAQESSINALAQSSVVFELRWRSEVSFLRKIGGSQLLGRDEVLWKDLLESPAMEIEKWVIMAKKSSRRVHDDSKPSAVKVSMKVQAPVTLVAVLERSRRRREVAKWDECGCRDGGCSTCADYGIFALAAVLDL